jgi:uroporphyrinogen-III synthase
MIFPLVAFADPEVFARLDEAIAQIATFDWVIFTSGQAVRAVVTRGDTLSFSLKPVGSRPLFAAVGPVTAKAVRQAGLAVEYVANTHNGVALADELGEQLSGRSVLVPRSDRANRDLPAALKKHGAQVTEVVAYRTLQPTDIDKSKLSRIVSGEADALLFFSPSAVFNFGVLAGGEELRRLQDKLAITGVGPVTADALREAGAERVVVAGETTAAAVVQALEQHFARASKQPAAGAKRG